jgi:hypothetical protein
MLRNEAERSRSTSAEGVDAIDLVMRGKALAIDIRQKGECDPRGIVIPTGACT